MTTHITSMTYKPKVPDVISGKCRRTTRIYNPERPWLVGDYILTHGWEGIPYRSPWSWRRPQEPIIKVIDMLASDIHAIFWQDPITGTPIGSDSLRTVTVPWDSEWMDEAARLDGIQPATGLEYKKVLEGFHKKFACKMTQFQIVEW